MKAVDAPKSSVYVLPPESLEGKSLHYCLVQVGKRSWAVAEYSGKVGVTDHYKETAGLEFVIVTDSMLRANAIDKLREFRQKRRQVDFEVDRVAAADAIANKLEYPDNWFVDGVGRWAEGESVDIWYCDLRLRSVNPIVFEVHRLCVFFAPGLSKVDRFHEEDITPTMLPELRKDASEYAMSSFDFGEGEIFVDNGKWDEFGDEWTCLMRLESADTGEEHKRGFIVRFKPGTAEVIEAYPGDIH